MSASGVLITLSWFKMAYSGMNISAGGIKYATSTAVLSGLVPFHFNRTSA